MLRDAHTFAVGYTHSYSHMFTYERTCTHIYMPNNILARVEHAHSTAHTHSQALTYRMILESGSVAFKGPVKGLTDPHMVVTNVFPRYS